MSSPIDEVPPKAVLHPDAYLTVLICTHNRAALLARTIGFLNQARRPSEAVEILVVANACEDGTLAFLQEYVANSDGRLPLRWVVEPIAGKSRALNRAIPEIKGELVGFVDDDHRVDAGYLVAVTGAGRLYPEAGLFCGRIHPDWDGTEPAWVHDTGPYRIYPLPVPRYDGGERTHLITAQSGGIPGGGNLVVRRSVFELAGPFAVALGPHGHDLGGGEDSEWVLRALKRGAALRYMPEIVQHHYVDLERLMLLYLMRKSYQRTRSVARVHDRSPRVPLYMWRKLGEYALQSLIALNWKKRRFFLVRTAAALGEIRGSRDASSAARRSARALPADAIRHRELSIGSATVLSGGLAIVLGAAGVLNGIFPALACAALVTAALLVKSIMDYSQTGPSLQKEILNHFRRDSIYGLLRLSSWAFVISLLAAGAGLGLYGAATAALGVPGSPRGLWLAASAGIGAATLGQLARKLVLNPGLLIASMHYRPSRLYALWSLLTPTRLRMAQWAAGLAAALAVGGGIVALAQQGRVSDAIALVMATAFYAGLAALAVSPEAVVARPGPRRGTRPNIVMIGSDTLRADRLGHAGYHRSLTPNIDRLAARGTLFTHCYVPCARTAPSLVSLLTGTWPHQHGIRDNFVPDESTLLRIPALPEILREHGYRTAVISDWCGADMGKFSFGFELTDLPEDQWNLRYLIRQGPKDLRLFVSLFMHNRLGRRLLPEIYYLGGVPLTSQLGSSARRLLSQLAAQDEPFLLNVFYSTTHPPFASEYPYYLRYANPRYQGESKFAMARLTDPFEIIRRQGDSRKEFDLDQIIDLYDGCVAQFDEEVGRMITHLEQCGLRDNTIVLLYSDHGMEFFEHDTWGQGNSVFGDASARVPLVIIDPRLEGRGVAKEVIRNIDVFPTLLELVGVAAPKTIDGESLVPLLHGTGPLVERVVFNETGVWVTDLPGTPTGHLRYPNLTELLHVPHKIAGTLALKPEYHELIVRAKDRMVRQGRWKLTYQPMVDGAIVRLFDVTQDPECRHDLRAAHPDIAKRLMAMLTEWLRIDGVPEQPSIRKYQPESPVARL